MPFPNVMFFENAAVAEGGIFIRSSWQDLRSHHGLGNNIGVDQDAVC
jgi:hypothetical protein